MILNFAHESELEELKHLDKIASLLPTKGVIQVNLKKFYGWSGLPEEVRNEHMAIPIREFSQISQVEARRNEIMAVLRARLDTWAKRRENVTEVGGIAGP